MVGVISVLLILLEYDSGVVSTNLRSHKMVRYGQGGYRGQSKSVRAVNAEQDGKYPLTTALRIVARELKITQKQARELCLSEGASEWHHVGKYANRCDYYNTVAIVDTFKARELCKINPTLKAEYFEIFDNSQGIYWSLLGVLAEKYNTTTDILHTIQRDF